MLDITAIILTYNEEANLEKCINSINGFCKRIVVVDSFSDDKTLEIAKKFSCDIYQNRFINHAKQFNFGMEVANISTEWVLRLDADERVSNKAKEEISKYILLPNVTGVVLPFEVTFLGKKLRHGGIYPIKKLRLFKVGCAVMEDRNMDERIVLTSGISKTVKSISEHDDQKDLKSWLNKHVRYVFAEAEDAYLINNNQTNYNSNKKRKFYYKLPSFLRAKLYYFYRYYLRLGFLDGKPGKYFALLQAYFYRIAVDAAIYERKIKNK